MQRSYFVTAALVMAVLGASACSDDDSAGARGAGASGGDGGNAAGAGSSASGSAGAAGAPMTEKSFTAAADLFLNPERGFYDSVELIESGDFEHVRAAGRTLAYDGVRLDAYRDAPLDAAFLDQLEAGFGRARDAGIKIVLRFVYNEGPYPVSEPDAPLDRVLEHLGQLAPVLADNADVIAVMQAGLIGAWGEWHSSTNDLDTPDNQKTILLALLDALPPSRMTQIRTPNAKSAIFGEALLETDAFTATDAARTGHHNDCFLATASDYGTYPDPVEDWKSFVEQEGRFTPVGGETCALNPPRTECAEATGELERLHWSFINAHYNTAVIDGWQSGGCLEDIDRRLGYRFSFSSAAYSEAVRPGGVLELEIQLENSGYATPYNARPVYVVLDDGTTRHAALLGSADPRRWERGTPRTISAKLRVPASAEPGTYRIALWLPDAAPSIRDRSEYAIRFANDEVWDSAAGYNVIADDLAIDDAAPGDVDPTATELVELP